MGKTDHKGPSLFSNVSPIQDLLRASHAIIDLWGARYVLEWDQETYMPKRGIDARSSQLGTLAVVAHEKLTSDDFGSTLNIALDFVAGHTQKLNDYDIALVRRMEREYNQAIRLPRSFVQKEAEQKSRAQETWQNAREKSDFGLFQEDLVANVKFTRERAHFLGFEASPYDALLDTYEPGLTVVKVSKLFDEVKCITASVLDLVNNSKASIDQSFLVGDIDRSKQWTFGLEILKAMGFDFDRGRQDESAHPFTIWFFSPLDIRLTTRFGGGIFYRTSVCNYARRWPWFI